MRLTEAIIKEAEAWLDCREDNFSNRSACVNVIQNAFYNNNHSGEYWCAMFVWYVAEEACKKLKVENPVLKSAGAKDIMKSSKLRKDNTPEVGSYFWRARTGGTGHVGYVVAVNDAGFSTIEGNTSGIDEETGKKAEGVFRKTYKMSVAKDYIFVHLEDLDTLYNNFMAYGSDAADKIIETAKNNKNLCLIGGATLAAYFVLKHKQIL